LAPMKVRDTDVRLIRSGQGMLPTFIVIGAAKCATTSVCDILGGHPQVFMSDPKEPHYFAISDPQEFEARRPWYEALFAEAGSALAVGEGSVSCTSPRRIAIAAPRIHATVPECRLIYMVRHPIRRLESDWRMMRFEQRVSGSVNEVLREVPNLLNWGFYWKHLNVYRSLFADEQILIVFFEDFTRHPHRELERIYAHIGVDSSYVAPDADRPRLGAGDFRRFGAAASALQRVPGLERVKHLVPRLAVEAAKRLFGRRETFEVKWDAATLRSVAEEYREDAAQLLAHCGKPPDYWVLDV